MKQNCQIYFTAECFNSFEKAFVKVCMLQVSCLYEHFLLMIKMILVSSQYC